MDTFPREPRRVEMRVRCPQCATLIVLKKIDGNFRGDCSCGFTFRGNAKVEG